MHVGGTGSVTLSDRPGKAVSQIYVAGRDGIRHLRAFTAILVPAGESVSFSLTLAPRALQRWDGGWMTQAGQHYVMLGWNSQKLPVAFTEPSV